MTTLADFEAACEKASVKIAWIIEVRSTLTWGPK